MNAGVRGAAVDVARLVIAKPIITVRDAATAVDKGYQTASNAVQRLVDLDIIREFGDSGHPKRYFAPEVVKALQAR